jgi:hypothetical protein
MEPTAARDELNSWLLIKCEDGADTAVPEMSGSLRSPPILALIMHAFPSHAIYRPWALFML